jgi:hypothetical protein
MCNPEQEEDDDNNDQEELERITHNLLDDDRSRRNRKIDLVTKEGDENKLQKAPRLMMM